MNGLSSALVETTSSLQFADVPDEVIAMTELSLLDGIGVSLAATGHESGADQFARLALEEGGRADATVLGTGQRVPAASAAFANGAMAHALDFEDAIDGLPVHPNAQSIPALLALAEQRDLSGERLLTALAVGCDVTARLAAAAGTTIGRRGWYPPPILGALGATIACSNLLAFTAAQTLDALSLVISQATASGEVKHSPNSIIRGVRDGFASHAAVRSVELAERGITGFTAPLEGKYGFFFTYAGGEYDQDALLDGLGTRFWGTELSFKPWPSCRGTHSFVEGAILLREHFTPEDIESVELIGAPVNLMLAEPLESKRRPSEAINAKFSLPFTVASALVHGDITFDSYTPEALRESRVLSLADRIDFTPDPARDNDESMTQGEIHVRLVDGRSFQHEVRTPLGNPASPLGVDRLRDKFVKCAVLASSAPTAERAAEIADRILAIRRIPHLRDELLAILAPS
jgi:2-methylcitrate dehydratase PrpD